MKLAKQEIPSEFITAADCKTGLYSMRPSMASLCGLRSVKVK
jgi:hypothetical protein